MIVLEPGIHLRRPARNGPYMDFMIGKIHVSATEMLVWHAVQRLAPGGSATLERIMATYTTLPSGLFPFAISGLLSKGLIRRNEHGFCPNTEISGHQWS